MKRAWLGLLVLTGACATAPGEQLAWTTPSGRPEGFFDYKTLTEASGMIANACMDGGLSVVGSTPAR